MKVVDQCLHSHLRQQLFSIKTNFKRNLRWIEQHTAKVEGDAVDACRINFGANEEINEVNKAGVLFIFCKFFFDKF